MSRSARAEYHARQVAARLRCPARLGRWACELPPHPDNPTGHKFDSGFTADGRHDDEAVDE